MLEKSKDHDRSVGDVGVELIPITENGNTRGMCPSAYTRARGSRSSSHDSNVDAGRRLDKFPFLRKYL